MSLAEFILKNAELNPDLAKEKLQNIEITYDILYDFYKTLKSKMITFKIPDKDLFETVGTGGSGLQRVNLSTALSLKLAKNFTIVKHGGKASSGRVGCFDILDKICIQNSVNSEQAIKSIMQNNYCFLFAGDFHPVFKFLAPIRKQIGIPTVINSVMPLLNPVTNLKAQMIGCSNYETMKLIAKIAQNESKNIIFVHDLENKLDDVSITGSTAIIEVKNQKINEYIIKPKDLGFKTHSLSEILGYADAEKNANLVMEILSGNANQSYIDFLNINYEVATRFFNMI